MDLIEAEEGVVFICGSEREPGGEYKGVIFVYDGATLTKVFTGPGGSGFYAIAGDYKFGRHIYTAGYETANGRQRPYLVYFDGSKWQKVVVPASATDPAFFDVSLSYLPLICWLSAGSHVYSYSGSVWRTDLTADFPEYWFEDVCAAPLGLVFVRRNDVSGEVAILAGNRTGSWREETLTLANPGLTFANASDLTLGEDTLFILGDLYCNHRNNKNELFKYEAILTRDAAPPGAGSYDIAFAAPHGPYINDFKAGALRGPAAGIFTGALTSVVWEGGRWVQEQAPAETKAFEAVCDGKSGYWAVSNGYENVPPILWRHK